MNRKELERARMENLRKFDQSYRPKINTVEMDINNSIEHELAKFICVWLIRNGVPANLLQKAWIEGTKGNSFHNKYFYILYDEENKFIKKYGQKFKHEWERPQIVTEARFESNLPSLSIVFKDLEFIKEEKLDGIKKELKKTRRADIFILDTGETVEIETGKSYDKEGAITVRI